MERENISNWLRDEIEKLEKQSILIENKMNNILSKNGILKLDQLNKLNREKEILQGQINKIYELIGRLPNEF